MGMADTVLSAVCYCTQLAMSTAHMTNKLTQHCAVQELAGIRQQLLAAELQSADAIKEAAHLRQQLRSSQSKSQSQSGTADAAGLSRQTSSVLDQAMRETYEALKEEFQSDAVYKVRLAVVTRR